MKSMKRVTLRDVANEANVSYATVSKVLSGKSGGNIRVGEKTREKILGVAKDLGYVPNHMARNLKKTDLSLISVFTYEDMSNTETYQEYYDFYTGIHARGETAGLDVLLLNSRKNISSSSRVTLSSGAVMLGVERDDRDIMALLYRKFPLVFIGRREIGGIKTTWVGFDYEGVILQIVKILVQKGIEKVLFLRSCDQTEPYMDKSHYLIHFAERFGIEISSMSLPRGIVPDKEQKQQLENHDFYLLDRIWQTELIDRYLDEQGLVLGKDKSVILMEDDWMNLGKWTSWNGMRTELGALAVEYLYAILYNRSLPKKNLVSLELVFRESFSL